MRTEPWGQLWPSRNTRSAVCHPPKDATGPDGPVSPLSSSRGEISAPWRSACPGEEEKVAASSDTPSIHLAPHSPSLTPQNFCHQPAHLQMRELCPCHLDMALQAGQGNPEVWPMAQESACLGSNPAAALYWLLTFSRYHIQSGPQCSHL